MKVLITGATGLIGSAVCDRLAGEGHEVVRVVRRVPMDISDQAVAVLDMLQAVPVGDWMPLLADVEAVVNCAGVLQDSAAENTQKVHADSAVALFLACERADVRRIIHFSAIGVDRAQPSPF